MIISNPNFEEQIDIVNTTIAEIGAESKPQIIIFNKIDATYEQKEEAVLRHLKKENMSLDDFKAELDEQIKKLIVFLFRL